MTIHIYQGNLELSQFPMKGHLDTFPCKKPPSRPRSDEVALNCPGVYTHIYICTYAYKYTMYKLSWFLKVRVFNA